VTIDVTLNAAGAPVAGVQNDLSVARSTGNLDPAQCVINPLVDKQSVAACVPSAGGGCSVVRALVLSLANTQQIPDDSVLYTCSVRIPDTAKTGTFPITCSNAAASDPQGRPLLFDCADGSISVEAPPPQDPPMMTGASESAQSAGGGCSVAHGTTQFGDFVALIIIGVALWHARRRYS
jgi:hypothetical protein